MRSVENYLIQESDARGKAAAIAHTRLETAQVHRADPKAWVADTIACISDCKIRKVDDLLPWSWMVQH